MFLTLDLWMVVLGVPVPVEAAAVVVAIEHVLTVDTGRMQQLVFDGRSLVNGVVPSLVCKGLVVVP